MNAAHRPQRREEFAIRRASLLRQMARAQMCRERGRHFAGARQIARGERDGGDALVAPATVSFRQRR